MNASDRKRKWQQVRKLLKELAPEPSTRPAFGSTEIWSPLREFDKLTPAEQEVLLLLLEGFSPFNIARKRGVSQNTIKTQRQHIYGKLGVSYRTDALRRVLPIKVTDRPKDPK